MTKYHYYSEKIKDLSMTEIIELLEKGEVTSVELVWAYVERMAHFDNAGPCLNSVRQVNPDAFFIAEERDYQRSKGEIMGPLHGVPILLKDCIDTKDKTTTTCGALALKDYYSQSDAFIVKLLKDAGAIILGKATMSEWYGYISTGSGNGYNGVNGPAKNPFRPGVLRPGGSSGGCAVAVSADMAAAAIGTETSGSITEPAYFNSVVGFKPTVGLVSRSGILPVMMCQDVPGTLTRGVKDAAVLLNVMSKRDAEDAGTWKADEYKEIDMKVFDSVTLASKKIGIVTEGYMAELDEEARKVVYDSLKIFENNGAEVIEIVGFLPGQLKETPEKFSFTSSSSVMGNAFKARLEYYLSQLGEESPIHSMKELIEWNKSHPEAIPHGQEYVIDVYNIENACANLGFVEDRFKDMMICGKEGLDRAFDKYNLDAVIIPGVSCQAVAPTAGNPVIAIPAGFSEESGPVGLNIVGKCMEDEELLKIAYACEKALPKRCVPNLD